ncbi:DMT family transporter [Ferrimonas balearica]|uniref:DMT family transporter n=1 Tax=Ferrimonas balearica TaxID=44012 RepID=UPI001C999434|nr:DMT family transporter [Ferrimonas balearica]MBY5920674.1 DMT family transporter [Ferrimonas balearica]MBY5996641.1 DMT family transporter [Ferrimonas balearica]
MKIVLSTALALIAFAGNSVLCRLALGGERIDAASFTAIRLLSGIVVLLLIVSLSQRKGTQVSRGSWKAALFLFLYAITFSYAYMTLDTGTGALILFGAVQVSMMLFSFLSGDRFNPIEWLGLIMAFTGFVYLMLPGVSAPSLTGFILMSVAGIAWGAYTLLGRGAKNPLSVTNDNFLRTLPFTLVLLALTLNTQHLSFQGVLLAVLSGGVMSGIGYALWYMALSGLSAIRAAILQLLVPIIAALGGILFAGETLSGRLMLSSLMILGGIWAVILGKRRQSS